MKYLVAMKNDFCLIEFEYFAQDKKANKIIGSHDPNRATHFSSKKEAEEFAKLFDLPTVVEPITKHLEKFSKCTYKYREIPMLDNLLNRPYKNEDAKTVLEWRLKHLHSPEKAVSYKNYATWPNLYQKFYHLWDFQIWNSRDYKQKFFTTQIYVNTDSKFEQFKSEFDLIKDECTFLNKEGYKMFPIFDKDLSEYGTRYFCYKSDDDCFIQVSEYSKPVSQNLEHSFEEMRRHYYYNEYTKKKQ